MKSAAAASQLGFQFPGTFQLSAMGLAARPLEDELPRLLQEAGVSVEHENTRFRYSSNRRYVSVTLVIMAPSRSVLEKAHQVVRSHPDVQWVL